MPVNRDLIESTKKTPEYLNGVAILGEPDDYANRTMLELIGFYYLMTIRQKGNIEGLDAFVRDMGIVTARSGQGFQFGCEDEEALVTAFTYMVGRNSKEYFEEFLKLRAQLTAQED